MHFHSQNISIYMHKRNKRLINNQTSVLKQTPYDGDQLKMREEVRNSSITGHKAVVIKE